MVSEGGKSPPADIITPEKPPTVGGSRLPTGFRGAIRRSGGKSKYSDPRGEGRSNGPVPEETPASAEKKSSSLSLGGEITLDVRAKKGLWVLFPPFFLSLRFFHAVAKLSQEKELQTSE